MIEDPDLSNHGVATALYRFALAVRRGEPLEGPAHELAVALRPDDADKSEPFGS